MSVESILKSYKESVKAGEGFFKNKKNLLAIVSAAELITESFKTGGKLMTMGNGGSAADSQHVAAEFVNRFEIERPPLPAISLSVDTSVITSVGNDYSFELVFAKQVKSIGRPNDVLLAISTSGKSVNVIKAVEVAKTIGIKTIALTGGSGGELAKKADVILKVDSLSTPRIQEVHIIIYHAICQMVDHLLFQKASK